MKMLEAEYQKIGQQIRLLRMRKGITQGELARRLGIAQAVLSAIEHGKMTTLKRLYELRDALGCSMRDFFEEEKPEYDFDLEEVLQAMRLMKELKSR